MEARMRNIAAVNPDAMHALQSLYQASTKSGVPHRTLELVHMRASQINGCHLCEEMGVRQMKQGGESDERIKAIANWRKETCFSDAERAALALAESVTKLPVPDDVWDAAAKYYNEDELASLIIAISLTNVWNRFNIATQQVAAAWS